MTHFEKLAGQNYSHLTNFLGGGFYDHFIPAAVDAIASRSEFYTAYTPYQPELSQGTLQAIYEYQTDICRLTGMEVANASLYDGGTALYEACQMAIHATGRRKVIMDGGVNPIYRKMLRSYTANLSIEFVEIAVTHGQSDRDHIFEALDDSTAAVHPAEPEFFRRHRRPQRYRGKGATTSASSRSSRFIRSRSRCSKRRARSGFDIATGEGQCLGIPLSFRRPVPRLHGHDERTRAQNAGPARWPHRGRPGRRGLSCSRCRRANSTSGAKRPPRTSARTRRSARFARIST